MMLGLVFRFNRLQWLHLSGSCVKSNKTLINFMHFHNSWTRNCDHHILFIMTGNAHKEFCPKLLLILVSEQGLYRIKTDCSGEMVVAFTIIEINYLMVSLFCDVVLPLACIILVPILAALLALLLALRQKLLLFSLYPVLQIFVVMILC